MHLGKVVDIQLYIHDEASRFAELVPRTGMQMDKMDKERRRQRRITSAARGSRAFDAPALTVLLFYLSTSSTSCVLPSH